LKTGIKLFFLDKEQQMRGLIIILILGIVCSQNQLLAKEVIKVWSYYSSPPFSLQDDKYDLTQILCRELTKKSKRKWTFRPKYTPRKRINQHLQRNIQGLVLWANPVWFRDKGETKYDWSKRVIWGSNEIVSLKKNPVEYTGPESLIGKKFV